MSVAKGWEFYNDGSGGSTESVQSAASGTGAFNSAALGSEIVEGTDEQAASNRNAVTAKEHNLKFMESA